MICSTSPLVRHLQNLLKYVDFYKVWSCQHKFLEFAYQYLFKMYMTFYFKKFKVSL